MEDKQTLINSEIRKFLSLQEERCLTYTVFNEAHKIYLASTDEKAFFKFSQIVSDVTEDFKRISLSIIEIEKNLRNELNDQVLSSMIRDIQNYEKDKLRLTAQMQIKMKEQNDSPSDELEDSISNLNKSLKDIVDGINKVIETVKYEIDE